MPSCFSTINHSSLIRRLTGDRREPSRLNRNGHSPAGPSHGIHILNVDVLLNIFYLYRLAKRDEYLDRMVRMHILWTQQRWWYKLMHVCRQWRNIILQSPSRLDLHLLCTHGVPVAKMLEHSPPLPLTILYDHTDQGPEITAQDTSGILLALSYRDRLRRICLSMLPNLGKFIMAMDGQFPVLERMHIQSQTELVLPVTFQAPNLRHLALTTASLPIQSPLLTTTMRLTYLNLNEIQESTYFPPSYLVSRLLVILQLEVLIIRFHSPLPSRDVQRQLHTPQVTLPNLHSFLFRGAATYLDGLVDQISAPSLTHIGVYLLDNTPVPVPHLPHFLQSSQNLRIRAVEVAFFVNSVLLKAATTRSPLFELCIVCRDLVGQVASAVDLFSALSPILFVVKKVTLTDHAYNRSLTWLNDVDLRRQWRELLRPFTNVKAITFNVHRTLIDEIFHSLLPAEGEPPLELLPELEELSSDTGELNSRAVSAFIDARNMVND